MRDWKLRLPTASAVLTVLYPEDFTVYDQRVCKMLDMQYRTAPFSETLSVSTMKSTKMPFAGVRQRA